MNRPSFLTFVLLTLAIVLWTIGEAKVAASLSLTFEMRLALGAAIGGLIVFTVYRSHGQRQ